MKTKPKLTIFCAIKSPLEHLALPESLIEQLQHVDTIFFSVEHAAEEGDSRALVEHYKCLGPKLRILRSKKPMSVMAHYKTIMQSRSAPDPDGGDTWITFLPEDSICHPKYLETLSGYINHVNNEEDVSCIAFPRKFYSCPAKGGAKGGEKGTGGGVLRSAGDVDDAIDKKRIRLEMNFCKQDEAYELYELVVRCSALRDFFRKTPDPLVRNRFCDIECSVFLTEHGRVLKGDSACWMLFARCFSNESSGGITKINNMYEAAPVIAEFAEMWHVPHLRATADRNMEILKDNFAGQEEAIAFFNFHYEFSKKKTVE